MINCFVLFAEFFSAYQLEKTNTSWFPAWENFDQVLGFETRNCHVLLYL